MGQEGRTLILGLGNPILGDDGVGIAIAREIRDGWPTDPSIDILEAGLAGRFLLDVITGYQTVVVADAIITDEKALAGSIYSLSVDDLGKAVNPYASHALDLRTTVELGKQLGYEMPETIRVYAVEIKENTVFREGLSREVEAAVVPVARKIMQDLDKTVIGDQ
ncbi:MAG: hydrogenase maturation protease [Deltaproteobacteria bacterium]|jgi:hydrogenase maturation protease|nr:hydrogenase maturation protease [Deltaproteobacteria bacterium]